MHMKHTLTLLTPLLLAPLAALSAKLHVSQTERRARFLHGFLVGRGATGEKQIPAISHRACFIYLSISE